MINLLLLLGCFIAACAITKIYFYIDGKFGNDDFTRLNDDLFRQKVKKVRRAGMQYYIDMMRTNPAKLAQDLADVQVKKFLKAKQIEEAYRKLEA